VNIKFKTYQLGLRMLRACVAKSTVLT